MSHYNLILSQPIVKPLTPVIKTRHSLSQYPLGNFQNNFSHFPWISNLVSSLLIYYPMIISALLNHLSAISTFITVLIGILLFYQPLISSHNLTFIIVGTTTRTTPLSEVPVSVLLEGMPVSPLVF